MSRTLGGVRSAPPPHPRADGYRRRVVAFVAFGTVVVLLSIVATVARVGPVPMRQVASAAERPNVVLIVTDDQRADSVWAMPKVRTLLGGSGVTFTSAVVSNPLCCPSRAAILTGTYSHTNGVWRNAPPDGGFESFDDRSTIATWLDRAGYRTGLFGKYLNGYRRTDGAYVPPGWDRWFSFRNPRYYDYAISDDGELETYGDDERDYSTRVLSRELLRFVGSGRQPFFALFAPYAPHKPSIPAPGDEDAFPIVGPPPSLAFDEADVTDKPAWVQALRRIGEEKEAKLVEDRRDALRSMLAVDRAVRALVRTLDERGVLEDTVIIFTSDNGFALGEHRWTNKRAAYEESIRVPLVVRYDALGMAGGSSDSLVANIDLAPTIAALAGVTASGADGISLEPILRDPSAARGREGVILEHLAKRNDVIPTYCGFRTARHVYVRYATGEEELYDLRNDPDQLRNVASEPGSGPLIDTMRSRIQPRCRPPDPAFSWSD